MNVLKPNPNTIETARFDHQSTILLPTMISLEIISILIPIARGITPKMVGKEVNIIGLSLCLQALTIWIDFLYWGDSSLSLLKVSIKTILLLVVGLLIGGQI